MSYFKYFFALITALANILLIADTINISTTGSDETGDGTLENPYATIQMGVDLSNDSDTLAKILLNL